MRVRVRAREGREGRVHPRTSLVLPCTLAALYPSRARAAHLLGVARGALRREEDGAHERALARLEGRAHLVGVRVRDRFGARARARVGARVGARAGARERVRGEGEG